MNSKPIAEAHTGSFDTSSRGRIVLEGLVIILTAPFLIMPLAYPTGTVAALLVLVTTWVVAFYLTQEPSSPFDALFVLWALVLMVSIVITADPDLSLAKITNLILGLAFWRYLLIAVRAQRSLYIAVAGFLLLGFGLSLIGIIRVLELSKISILLDLNIFRKVPLPGLDHLTIHPNQIAGLICLYLPLSVSLVLRPPAPLRAWHWRLPLIPVTLITMWILLLTQSRSGWIGILVGIFVLAVMWAWTIPPSNRRRALRLTIAGCVLAGLLVITVIGPEQLGEVWANPPQETAVGTLLTLNYRKALWPWALTAIQDFPFTGVGLGAFRRVVFRLYPLSMSIGQDIGHAHNIFLQTALDVGLPGLAVYLALLFAAGIWGLRVARRDATLRPVSLGLLAGLLAVHIFGLADALALGSKPGILFWYSLGLLAAMSNMIRRPDHPDSHPSGD